MIWNVEFHCHTRWSKDSLNDPAALLRTLQQRQLDRLFITDHNSIAGAKVAQALDPQHILIGEEIRTQQGELLALFVREEVPARLPAQQTIQLLRQQGAFISVSHPFDRQRGWQLPDLLDILPQIDAIETFNARCLSNRPNQQAADFAAAHNLPGTVGSDAHTLPKSAGPPCTCHPSMMLKACVSPIVTQLLRSASPAGKCIWPQPWPACTNAWPTSELHPFPIPSFTMV